MVGTHMACDGVAVVGQRGNTHLLTPLVPH